MIVGRVSPPGLALARMGQRQPRCRAAQGRSQALFDVPFVQRAGSPALRRSDQLPRSNSLPKIFFLSIIAPAIAVIAKRFFNRCPESRFHCLRCCWHGEVECRAVSGVGRRPQMAAMRFHN